MAPSIGQTNRLRSNKPYAPVDQSLGALGQCDFKWTRNQVEPADEVKGDAARVWLYMALQHGAVLTDDQITMFIDWTINDPPGPLEFERNNRVKALQGNGNPFIEVFE